MGKQIRVIPRLDIKGPNLVKGIHMEGLRVLGDPKEFAKYYYLNGADEIILNDITASLFSTNPQLELVQGVASNVFVPLTYSGGIRSIEDIRNVLKSGADKVCINSYIHENFEFIHEAVKVFGASTIVIGIEAIKQYNGNCLASYWGGRELSIHDVVTWAMKVEMAGAGEILLSSVNMDGTGRGFDVDTIRQVTNAVSIPVIASGGAGSKESIIDLIDKVDISGVSIASVLHYNICHQLKSDELYSRSEGNFTFLKDNGSFDLVKKVDLSTLKKDIVNKGILCRRTW